MPQVTLGKELSDSLFINISHFTWDWFWMKIADRYSKEVSIFVDLYSKFDHYVFGYLTPNENISLFSESKTHRIGLILQHPPKNNFQFKANTPKILNCLLMDNGTKTLSNLIEKALPELAKSPKYRFFVGIDTLSNSAIKQVAESSNMIPVSGLKEMHETMIDCDFVVARGGSNTISEVIAYKIPALLIKETDNPEISWNIDFAILNNFCRSIDPDLMINGLLNQIDEFVLNDYAEIYNSLINSNISINGEKEMLSLLIKLINA